MIWASLLISAALLTGVFLLVDWALLAGVAAAARWDDMAAATILYLLMIGVRGFRLSFLLTAASGRTYPLSSGLHLASFSAFANHLLPIKGGDVAVALVPWMVQRMQPESGVATLLLTRIHDVLALLCMAALALIAIAPWGSLLSVLAAIALVICLLGCVRSHEAIVLVARAAGIVLSAAQRFLKRRIAAGALVDRLAGCGQAFRGRSVGVSLLLSLLLWVTHTAFIALLLEAVGIQLPYAEIFLGSLGATAVQLLPLSAIGNLGTYELGWVAGFTAAGMTPAQAAATAILTHGLAILVSAAAAALSLLVIGPGMLTTYRRWRHDVSIP